MLWMKALHRCIIISTPYQAQVVMTSKMGTQKMAEVLLCLCHAPENFTLTSVGKCDRHSFSIPSMWSLDVSSPCFIKEGDMVREGVRCSEGMGEGWEGRGRREGRKKRKGRKEEEERKRRKEG